MDFVVFFSREIKTEEHGFVTINYGVKPAKIIWNQVGDQWFLDILGDQICRQT